LVLFSPNPNAPAYNEAQRKQITRDHLAWAQAQFESKNAVLASRDGAGPRDHVWSRHLPARAIRYTRRRDQAASP
jgi:hypothetical protein